MQAQLHCGRSRALTPLEPSVHVPARTLRFLQAWLLTSHPTFSDLLQVQQGLGAAQVSFAGAGAWKTSQKLWGLFAQKDNGLLQSYKFLKRKMRIRMLGVKGFRFWPSPHLKGRTATNQQRVQRWLPQCHCDNWPLFSLPSDQNYPAPKRRRSNKIGHGYANIKVVFGLHRWKIIQQI